MAGIVGVPTRTGNRPTAIHRFQAIHDSRLIFDEVQVTPGQLAQHAYARLAMVNRLEIIKAQAIGEFARIDPVTLVAVFEQRVLPRITYHQFVNVRLEQIVQPGSPSSFFEGHRQSSA